MEDEKQLFDILSKIPNFTKRDLVAGLALVGSAYLAYEEQQKAQNEQLRQNKDIEEIRKILAEVKQEQANQKEEQKRQIERIRQEKENQIENIKQERQQERREFQREKEQWETEKTACQESLENWKKQAEEKDKMIQTKEMQLKEIKDKYKEIESDWTLYKEYKIWIAKNSSKIHLNLLDCSKFEAFITCCGRKKILQYIFKELSSIELWDWAQEDIEILDKVIDCCCALQNLKRANPQLQELYNTESHYKQENAPSNGHIVDVLLRGVCVNGEILEDCKSFIKLVETEEGDDKNAS